MWGLRNPKKRFPENPIFKVDSLIEGIGFSGGVGLKDKGCRM